MGFTRNDVEALSARLGEPDWVTEQRLEAWGWFEKLELPAEKDEPWRYTNLARLKFQIENFSPAEVQVSSPAADSAAQLFPEVGAKGYQRGGEIEVGSGADSDGVIVTDIHTAIKQYPELVKPRLFAQFDAGSHIFTALHGALFSGGTFVYVPRGKTVTLPLLYGCTIEEPGSAVFPHNLVVAEENSEVCYVQHLTSPRLKGTGLCLGATEVDAAQASRVMVATFQEFGPEVWHLENQRFRTGRDANFKSLILALGSKFSRTETTTEIQGEGNSVEMMGIYVAGEGQHLDFRTLQDHAAAFSTSDLLYKGALKGNARTVYSGQIRVRPEGRETDAYQTNRNLILSDHAIAQSKPELEIENNDVRCSHAASVGQMDENEVFYLQTRGIDRAAAERLIVKGFLEEVLGKVSRKDVAAAVQSLLQEKLSS